MALSTQDLAWMRQWLGATPDEDTLETAVGLWGSRTLAALTLLRERLADLTATPASYSIPGDVTVNGADNLRALRKAIGQLERLAATEGLDPGAVPGVRLVRHGGGWGR